MKRFTANVPACFAATLLCLLVTTNPAIANSNQPEIALSASTDQVLRNNPVTLMWEVSNAEACHAGGDWSGTKANQGHETITGLVRDATFEMHCYTSYGAFSSKVEVAVIEQDEVEVTLTAIPQSIQPGGSVTLNWQAQNASQCTASGDWLGPQPAAGSLTINGIDDDRTFSLNCGTGASSALATVSVALHAQTLEWIAPTRDADGQPLTSLTGYRVYWGTASGNYTDSAIINDPGATEWDILAEPGITYFAISALSEDQTESALSNEVVKTVTANTAAKALANNDTTPRSESPVAAQKSLAALTAPQTAASYATLATLFRELIGSNAQIYQTLATAHFAGVCSDATHALGRAVALERGGLAHHSALAADHRAWRIRDVDRH